MAVTFTQTPTTPNGSQSTIVYGVNNLTPSSSAKYICDIKDNDTNELLVRIKQPANNSGYGVFEISDILHDYMDYDPVWKITTPTQSTNNNSRVFSIEFGEEYVPSGSTALTVSPSEIVDTLTMYPAVTDPIDGFNWDSGSYYNTFLSTHPYGMFMRTTDYGTISKMNINGASISSYTIVVFDEPGNVLASKTITNPIAVTNNSPSKLVHLPIGPANFKDDPTLNILSTDNWYFYLVLTTPDRGAQIVLKLDTCSDKNGVRFAFINRLGVWDYWTASLTRTETENYSTDTYEQTFVDFSTTDGAIPYESYRRGTTVYNKKIDTQLTAQTDWLDDDRANYLIELFQSPSVFVQYEDEFIPVIITNNSVQKRTNPKGQKLFSYKIEYKYANPRKSRR
jgi:hypothetical protein